MPGKWDFPSAAIIWCFPAEQPAGGADRIKKRLKTAAFFIAELLIIYIFAVYRAEHLRLFFFYVMTKSKNSDSKKIIRKYMDKTYLRIVYLRNLSFFEGL